MKQISLFLFTGLMALSPFFLTAQNNCLDFDGTADYVDAGNNAVLTFGTGQSFTYEAWVYSANPSSDNWQGIIYHGNEGTSQGHLGINPTGYLSGGTGNGSVWQTVETTYSIPQNTWVHLAMALNRTSNYLKFYVNGVEVSSTSFSYVPTSPTANLTIALGSGGEYFTGKIDEVRIWNDVRTETEIRQNIYRELPNSAGETNLVAYYKFNETFGTTLTDSKGSNDGTLTNMAGNEWQTSPAIFGPKNALDFDGTDDFAENSTLMVSGSAFTVETWVYFNSFNASGAPDYNITNLFRGGDENIVLRIGDGGMDNNMPQFVVTIGVQQKLNANARLSTNTWYHIAGVYDGAEMRLYINGELDNSQSQTGSLTTTSNPFWLGGNDDSRLLDGLIDEIRVWSDARTATEIRENMCKNLNGNESDLMAYYSCDNSSGTTLQDFSGNGYDGALTNMDDNDWVSSAAFNIWLNTNSSSWPSAINWSRESIPGSSDNVGIYTYSGGTNMSVSGSPTADNFILGSSSSMTLSSGLTVNGNLILENDLDLNGQTITMGTSAYLIEDIGRIYGTSGQIQTTRTLSNISNDNVAGLGAEITTSANMGSTVITRTHAANASPKSIKRRFDISPTNNTGLNATLVFHYKPVELNGLDESTLDLLRSTDGGTNWNNEGGTVDGNANTITLTSITAFSEWTAGGDATQILATANPSQDYFSGTTAVVIAPAVTITSSQDITAATISVSPVDSCDVLSVSGLPGGLTSSWNDDTKILTITGTSNASDYQTALRLVKFESTSLTSGTRTIDFNLGDGIGFTIDGQKHFYELVGDGITTYNWTVARTAATGSSYAGASGYLATITSATENTYLKEKVAYDTWIGGSDVAAEGVWKWMDGPEAGTQFWSGGSSGHTVNDNFCHWFSGEPNNASNEDYCHMRGSDLPDQWGYWNDYSNTTGVKYYITEYGGDGTIFTTMDDASVEVNTDLTWDGSESSNWAIAANWEQDLAPNTYLNVLIPDVSDKKAVNPIIGESDDITINNLIVDGGSLTIASTSSGTGSLIVNGTATGDVTIKRYVDGWSDNHGWHFLSSPVEAQAINPNFVDISGTISADLDFYRWSESEGLWINIKSGSSTYNQGIGETYFSNDENPTFTTGKGYLIAYKDEDTKTFNGSFRTTDYGVTGLTYTSGKDYAGWHLLGNPFSSALDFNAGTWNKSGDIGAYAQIWNETAASYKVLRAEQNIPALNGFMVYTSSSDGYLTIPVDARIHSDSNWYKSTVNEEMIVLTAIDNQTHTSQETVINFNAEATDDFDLKYDSYFIAGFAPMFYTSQYNKHYALNCLPELTQDLSVHLGFVKNNSTEFVIQLTESNCDLDIYITDTKLNETQNLSQNPVYLFSAFVQDDSERFVIHFSPLGTEELTSTQELIQIWTSNNSINILNTNNYVGDINVVNLFGQTILSTKIKKILNLTIPVASQGVFRQIVSAKKLKTEFSLFYPSVSHTTDISPENQWRV